MVSWKYCPQCFKLADGASRLRQCPYCARAGILVALAPLPVPHEVFQAAHAVGGRRAVAELVIHAVMGDAGLASIADKTDAYLGVEPCRACVDEDKRGWSSYGHTCGIYE